MASSVRSETVDLNKLSFTYPHVSELYTGLKQEGASVIMLTVTKAVRYLGYQGSTKGSS